MADKPSTTKEPVRHLSAGMARLLHEHSVMKRALEEIRDHWATDYDHDKANTEMYRGPYGIGIVDGHRACASIADQALRCAGVAD